MNGKPFYTMHYYVLVVEDTLPGFNVKYVSRVLFYSLRDEPLMAKRAVMKVWFGAETAYNEVTGIAEDTSDGRTAVCLEVLKIAEDWFDFLKKTGFMEDLS